MPFPQHMYDAVAAAVAQQMSVHQMQVDVPALRGMSGKAVLQLAKKAEDECPGGMACTAITREKFTLTT